MKLSRLLQTFASPLGSGKTLGWICTVPSVRTRQCQGLFLLFGFAVWAGKDGSCPGHPQWPAARAQMGLCVQRGSRRDSAKGLESWIMQRVRNALNKNSFWLRLLMEPGAQTCQPQSVSESPRSSSSVPAASCGLDPEKSPAENSSLWSLSPYLYILHPSTQKSFYLLMKGRKQT